MNKFPTEDKRGLVEKRFELMEEKSLMGGVIDDDNFNDDESRIPFMPENYCLEKSGISTLQFDLDIRGRKPEMRKNIDCLSPIMNDSPVER